MDEQTERRCIAVLREAIKPNHSMILVTHKPSLLALVDRLIVISGHQVILDGPRDTVIAKIQEGIKNQQAQSAAQTSNTGAAS